MRLLKSLILFMNLIVLCGARSYYEPSNYTVLPDAPTPKDWVEADPQFSPNPPLDQQETDTCFVHAAYFLIQYYYSFFYYYHLNGHPIRSQISLIDFLGQTCGEEIPTQGGFVDLALHRAKDRRILVNAQLDIGQVYELNEDFDDLDINDPNDFKDWVDEVRLVLGDLADSTLEHRLNQVRPFNQQFIFRSLMAGIAATTSSSGPIQKVTLPRYNVHSFEFDKYVDQELKTKRPGVSPEELVLDLVRSTLKPIQYGKMSITLPISIGFCDSEENGKCSDALHAMVIFGARKTCSENCDQETNWIEEWDIRNSYGGEQEGWHRAKPLIESILKHKGDVTYIRPCSEPADVFLSMRDLPKCQNYILGAEIPSEYGFNSYSFWGVEAVKKMVNSRDFSGLEQVLGLLDHPAHQKFTFIDDLKRKGLREAARYRQWPFMWKLIENEKRLSTLRPQELSFALKMAIGASNFSVVAELLNQGADAHSALDSEGTPLGWAIKYGNTEILKFILQFKPDLDQPVMQHMGPLSYAAFVGNLDAIRILRRAGADLELRDQNGWTPIVYALDEGDVEGVRLLLEEGASPSPSIFLNNSQLLESKILAIQEYEVRDEILKLFWSAVVPRPEQASSPLGKRKKTN